MEIPTSSSFEASINSPDVPVAVDFESTRAVLLIAFGGLAGKLGMSVFEFFNLTSRLMQLNKIFLRDESRLWYLAGLRGVGSDPPSVAAYLRQYTEHPSTQRVIIVGNSGGGYAALLFGHMLEADEVHAFSPKTFLHPLWRMAALDVASWRNFRQIMRLWRLRQQAGQYFDLKRRLSQSPTKTTRFHIYFSSKQRADRLQAVRMETVPGVCLHSYSTRGHDLIRQLKQSGELRQIVEGALSG